MPDRSALQVAVPAVDPLLEQLRPTLPAGATVLEPAHISFGYPWLDPPAARDVLDDVAAVLAEQAPFAVELTGPHRFAPDHDGRVVVWLEPQPAAAVRALGWLIADASGHDTDGFMPHCSLVRLPEGVDPAPLEQLVTPNLPLPARLDHVEFRVEHNGTWTLERTIPLGAGAR